MYIVAIVHERKDIIKNKILEKVVKRKRVLFQMKMVIRIHIVANVLKRKVLIKKKEVVNDVK